MLLHNLDKNVFLIVAGVVVYFSDGITDDAVRRYLARKPMTTTDLVQKFRNKYPNMSKDTLVTTIAHILKRIPLHKETIKDKLYLSIKNK